MSQTNPLPFQTYTKSHKDTGDYVIKQSKTVWRAAPPSLQRVFAPVPTMCCSLPGETWYVPHPQDCTARRGLSKPNHLLDYDMCL